MEPVAKSDMDELGKELCVEEDNAQEKYETDVANATTMMREAKKLIEESKKLLRGDDLSKLEEQLGDIVTIKRECLSESEDSDNEDNQEVSNLATAISTIKLSNITKLYKFSKGENFARYCDRFLEFIRISRVRDPNLYLFFLQKMDNETYTILKTAKLSAEEKANAKLFIKIYKDLIYGNEKMSLRNEVIDCKQNFGENVRDYACRILEKSNMAFDDPKTREEYCLMAFLRGVRNTHIKRKLNEVSLEKFDEAVRWAEKLERIERMLNPEQNVAPILRENSDFSFRPRRVESRSRSHERSSSRGRSNSWRSNSSQGSERHSRSRDESRSRSRERGRSWSNGSRNREQRKPFFNNNRGGWRSQRGRNSRGGPSRNQKTDKICWNCQKRGHLRRNCWSRRPLHQQFQQDTQARQGQSTVYHVQSPPVQGSMNYQQPLIMNNQALN